MITRKKKENEHIKQKKGFICDMDGVMYHGSRLLPGAKEFVEWLTQNNKKFLFLTNSSERSPRELSEKLSRLGLDVPEDHFYTSAIATAAFLASQTPHGSAYVIGEAGLINAIYAAGLSMNDVDPDYVVVGETPSYTLTFKDYGIGVCKDDISKLFDRFHRGENAKKEYPGTGLGLSIVARIIKAHKGIITIDSEINQWTLVKITLPLQ